MKKEFIVRCFTFLMVSLITHCTYANHNDFANILKYGHFSTVENGNGELLTGTIGKTTFDIDASSLGAGSICLTDLRFQVRDSSYAGNACSFSLTSLCPTTYAWYEMYRDKAGFGFNVKDILGSSADFPFSYRIFTSILNANYPTLPSSMCDVDPGGPEIGSFDKFTISVEGYTSSNSGVGACDGTNILKTFKSDDATSSCTMNTFSYNGDRTAFIDSNSLNTIDMIGATP